MTDLEKRGEAADAEPESAARRSAAWGLSPQVEKMFGALVDEQVSAKAQPGSTRDASHPARHGAA